MAYHTIWLEKNKQGHEMVVCGPQQAQVRPKSRFTPELRITDMDSLNVDAQVLSTHSALYNYHLDTKIALATSKDANDEVSETVKGWPSRFAGLSTLPMQDVPTAIKELERSIGHLGLKGVMTDDKVNGRTFDDPIYLPFAKAAEHMGAPIFFHQGGPTIVNHRLDKYNLPNTNGNLADRAVPSASLVFGGVMDACPDLKGCFSHGGGCTCFGIVSMDRQVRSEARATLPNPPST